MVRVSVVCTYFNSVSFLAESIESVLGQSFSDWELLLVDDGSTDGSHAIAKRYADRYPDRIVRFQHAGRRNRGISSSRNLGIRHAQGELVALIDSDDIWLPDMLRKQVANLDRHPEAVMAFAAAERWYQWPGNRNRSIGDFIVRSRLTGKPGMAVIEPPLLLSEFVGDESKTPCTCTVLVRKADAIRCGGFAEDFPGLYDDQVFYARLCAAHPVYAEQACLARYRQHAGSCCASASASGTDARERAHFLDWLLNFISTEQIDDRDLCLLVQREREQIMSLVAI